MPDPQMNVYVVELTENKSFRLYQRNRSDACEAAHNFVNSHNFLRARAGKPRIEILAIRLETLEEGLAREIRIQPLPAR